MSGRITLPLEGRTAMTLRIRPGLRDAKLHAETMGDHLLTVDGNGDRPKVRAAGAEVEVIHPRFSPRRPDGSEIITLNDAVAWDIAIDGGVGHVTADLTSAQLRSLTVSGGMADVDLYLPQPVGTAPVRLAAVSRVALRRPTGVPVRVTVERGLRDLVVDQQRIGAAGGRTIIADPGYHDATDRIDIHVNSVSDLTVTTA